MYQTEVSGQSLSSGTRHSFAKSLVGTPRRPCKSHAQRGPARVLTKPEAAAMVDLFHSRSDRVHPSPPSPRQAHRRVGICPREACRRDFSATSPKALQAGKDPDAGPLIEPIHRGIPARSFRPHPRRRMPAATLRQLLARSKEAIAAQQAVSSWTTMGPQFSIPQDRHRDRAPGFERILTLPPEAPVSNRRVAAWPATGRLKSGAPNANPSVAGAVSRCAPRLLHHDKRRASTPSHG